MALILCIEAGTDVGSVALAKNGELLSLLENLEGRQHAQNLAVYVQEVLQEHDLDAGDLDAVAVGKGPGSYTGLRIAVSLAKGICYGAGIPLIAVNSLEALVHVALEDFDAGILGVDDMRNHEVAADDRRPPDGGVLPVVRCGGEAALGSDGAYRHARKFSGTTYRKGRIAGVREWRGEEPGAVYRAGRTFCGGHSFGSRTGQTGFQGLCGEEIRRYGLLRTILSEKFCRKLFVEKNILITFAP